MGSHQDEGYTGTFSSAEPTAALDTKTPRLEYHVMHGSSIDTSTEAGRQLLKEIGPIDDKHGPLSFGETTDMISGSGRGFFDPSDRLYLVEQAHADRKKAEEEREKERAAIRSFYQSKQREVHDDPALPHVGVTSRKEESSLSSTAAVVAAPPVVVVLKKKKRQAASPHRARKKYKLDPSAANAAKRTLPKQNAHHQRRVVSLVGYASDSSCSSSSSRGSEHDRGDSSVA
jgi:hypothetical protein